jgi:cell division septum initiation protein DivIVA
MKLPTLLLLVSATGLFAAEEAKPAATTAAPAAAATAPAAAPKASKVPGVSDEDYQRYINTRVGIENNDPEIKALKAAAEAAKAEAKSAAPADKAAADKKAKDADKAFSVARAEAVVKKVPELADAAKKIGDFWTKEAIAKKKKKAAEAAAPATK